MNVYARTYRPEKFRATPVAVALLIMALAAHVAFADVISYSDDFYVPLSPGSTTVLLPQFDDHDGAWTLDSVTLTLFGEVYANISAENRSTLPAVITVNLTGVLTAAGGGVSTLAWFDASTVPVSLSPTNNVPGSGPDFYNFGQFGGMNTATVIKTSGLSPFVGTGTVPVLVNGSAGFSISGTTDSTLQTSDFHGKGDVMVTYAYTVPEPVTVGTLLLGAVPMLRRRFA